MPEAFDAALCTTDIFAALQATAIPAPLALPSARQALPACSESKRTATTLRAHARRCALAMAAAAKACKLGDAHIHKGGEESMRSMIRQEEGEGGGRRRAGGGRPRHLPPSPARTAVPPRRYYLSTIACLPALFSPRLACLPASLRHLLAYLSPTRATSSAPRLPPLPRLLPPRRARTRYNGGAPYRARTHSAAAHLHRATERWNRL